MIAEKGIEWSAIGWRKLVLKEKSCKKWNVSGVRKRDANKKNEIDAEKLNVVIKKLVYVTSLHHLDINLLRLLEVTEMTRTGMAETETAEIENCAVKRDASMRIEIAVVVSVMIGSLLHLHCHHQDLLHLHWTIVIEETDRLRDHHVVYLLADRRVAGHLNVHLVDEHLKEHLADVHQNLKDPEVELLNLNELVDEHLSAIKNVSAIRKENLYESEAWTHLQGTKIVEEDHLSVHLVDVLQSVRHEIRALST